MNWKSVKAGDMLRRAAESDGDPMDVVKDIIDMGVAVPASLIPTLKEGCHPQTIAVIFDDMSAIYMEPVGLDEATNEFFGIQVTTTSPKAKEERAPDGAILH